MSVDQPSALVADLGTASVRAFVLEHVEGEQRLVATVSVPIPSPAVPSAVAAAFAAAVRQVLTLSSDPQTTADMAPHLLTNRPAVPRVLLIAPRPNQAASQTLQALAQSCVHLLEPLYVGGREAPPLATVAERLWTAQPDTVVLLCSGRQQDWLRVQAVAELLAQGVARSPVLTPVVVGDAAAALDAVTQALGSLVPPDSAPAAASSELVGRLRAVHRRRIEAALHQDEIRALPAQRSTSATVASSLQAMARAARLLARRYDLEAAVMEIGVGHAATYAAAGHEAAHFVRADLGARYGPATVLREVGPEAVRRWLPTDVPVERLHQLAALRMAHPTCPAITLEDLLIEHAFLREQVHLMAAELRERSVGGPGSAGRPVDLLVAAGSVLAQTPRVTQAVLILLDALQPEALTHLAIDRAGGLPVLGLLSPAAEGKARPLLEGDAVLNMGLVVAPVGRGREGQTVITTEVAYANRSPITVEVPYGSLAVVPLPAGERAALKLFPAPDFDIGLGRGKAATPRFEVDGGVVGIIIDARGRPLELPQRADRRQARMLDWFQSLAAYPPLSFVTSPSAESADRPAAPPSAEVTSAG